MPTLATPRGISRYRSAQLPEITVVLTGAAGVAILFSIAASETLLVLAWLCFLMSRRSLVLPGSLGLPLVCFAAWTLLATALSSDPAGGLPQVRKLSLLLIVLLVGSAFYKRMQLWRLVQGLIAAGAIAACYGLAQFGVDFVRIEHCGQQFYDAYVVHQITGFMSHWMTYSGQLMMVLLLLVAVLLFSRPLGAVHWGWLASGWAAAVLMGLALLAAFTRGMWLATLLGLIYLFGSYRRWMGVLVPVAALVLFLLAPSALRRRGESAFEIEGDTSTTARVIMIHTGLAMIAAHPVFGIGPERVGPEFRQYTRPGQVLPPAYYGHLHNVYLQIAAERGIPCMLFLLWLFANVLIDNFRRTRSPDQRLRVLGMATVAATLAIMAAGLIEYNIGESEVLILFLFVISIPVAWEHCQEVSIAAPIPGDAQQMTTLPTEADRAGAASSLL